VYARENGKGMLFPDEDIDDPEPPKPTPPAPPSGGKPSLKVVK
jgi:stringent starvation protein B